MVSERAVSSTRATTKKRRTGKIPGVFLRDVQGSLDVWMLGRAPASSPAHGLHRHGPRYYTFFLTSE